MLEAKASIPTTSIAGGLFMLKRTKINRHEFVVAIFLWLLSKFLYKYKNFETCEILSYELYLTNYNLFVRQKFFSQFFLQLINLKEHKKRMPLFSK